MFKTLKINALLPVKTGGVYALTTTTPTPPLPSELVDVSKTTLLSSDSTDAPVTPSIFEAAVGSSIEIASGISLASEPIITVLDSAETKPTSLAPGVFYDGVYDAYGKKPPTKPYTDIVSSESPKYGPLVDLKGIDMTRPTLIGLLDFEPIYLGSNATEAGRFLRQQYDFRNVRESSISRLLAKLSSTFGSESAVLTDDNLSLDKRIVSSEEVIRKEKQNVSDLYAIFNSLDNFVALFDLRNPAWIEILSRTKSSSLQETLIKLLYGLPYSGTDIINISSSKIWAQVVLYLKEAIRTNSIALRFLIPPRPATTEQKFIEIDKPIAGFKLDSDPLLLSNAIISEINWLDSYALGTDVTNLINGVKNTFNLINVTSPSDNNTKVSALANAICKETYLSNKLSTESVISELKTSFDYTVNVGTGGNLSMLDSIFGTFGDKVTKFTKQDRSIVSVSHENRNSGGVTEGVLVFETSFIKEGESVITPGSEYYVEQYFRETSDSTALTNSFFSSIRDLAKKLDNGVDSLRSAQKLLCFTYSSSRSLVEKDLESLGSLDWAGAIKHPSDLIAKVCYFYTSLIRFPVVDDVLLFISLMKSASENLEFKSLLFTYFMFMLTQDKCPAKIIDDMVKILKDKYRSELAGDSIVGILIKDKILAATLANPKKPGFMGTGGSALRIFMQCLNDIKTGLTALSVYAPGADYVSRFSNQVDTNLLLAAFEIFVNISTSIKGGEIKKYFYNLSYEQFYVTSLETDRSVLELRLRLNGLPVDSEITHLNNAFDSLIGTLSSFSAEAKKILLNQDSWQATLANFSIKNREQVNLYAERVRHVENLYNGDSKEFMFIDESTVTDRDWYVLDRFLRSQEVNGIDLNSSDAFNKKILSVGIPTGFVQRLRRDAINESLSRSLTGIRKQYDVVYLNVYKQDGNYPDIIYKPLKFLFEVSRFPVRSMGVTNFELGKYPYATYNVQTYDLGSATSIEDGEIMEQFYPRNWEGVADDATTVAFSSSDYNFLKPEEKAAIAQNHVVSYLLEIYARLTSGLLLSEQHHYDGDFLCLNENLRSTLARGALALVSDPDLGKGSPLPTLADALNSVTSERKKDANQALKLIASLSRSLSNYSDSSALTQKLRYPRKFDRVFNVIFDPDDFEVDVTKTQSRDSGKAMLEELVKRKPPKIVNVDGKYYGSKRTVKNDILHETYYVTLENYKLSP